ncbi:hypothetical protein DL96DRAFT_1612974 [Flagelloscypha sp. PMI_526]|nr:hypothetical protein DL96DRAFT_1612974 [Flagelloscypha sp. PMI_526]
MASQPSSSMMDHARTLMARKEKIEAEIEAHGSVLRTNNSTMQSPLVDAQGFPRDDVDIYAVRTARVRIIELRNDLKQVMNDIGKALEGVYQPTLEDQVESTDGEDLIPFARVNAVSPSSPASEAGLLKEDLILKFGPLTHTSCLNGLGPVAQVVADNENKTVVIKSFTLSPRAGWGGRGMLGCHIVPSST